MKFSLKLKDHEVGTLKLIVATQVNSEGKTINETEVGYIEGKYADRLEFKTLTD